MSNVVLITLKMLALKALPQVEMQSVAWLATQHEKLSSPEKREMGIDYVVAQYAAATKGIPALNATTIDDAIVRQLAGEAVDWAFEQIGAQLNHLAHTPVNNDSTLKPGGLL